MNDHYSYWASEQDFLSSGWIYLLLLEMVVCLYLMMPVYTYNSPISTTAKTLRMIQVSQHIAAIIGALKFYLLKVKKQGNRHQNCSKCQIGFVCVVNMYVPVDTSDFFQSLCLKLTFRKQS